MTISWSPESYPPPIYLSVQYLSTVEVLVLLIFAQGRALRTSVGGAGHNCLCFGYSARGHGRGRCVSAHGRARSPQPRGRTGACIGIKALRERVAGAPPFDGISGSSLRDSQTSGGGQAFGKHSARRSSPSRAPRPLISLGIGPMQSDLVECWFR